MVPVEARPEKSTLPPACVMNRALPPLAVPVNDVIVSAAPVVVIVAFAAVLSDLLMPNVNGAELYVALGEQAPDLRSRFVLMTGCDSDPWVSRFLAESNVPVLRKPFRAAELRARVDAVLGGGHVPNRLSDQGFSR